jgi:hypothetical protein
MYKVAIERKRPEKPEGVDERVWAVMEKCWAHEPATRPAFREVQEEPSKIVS